MCVCVINPSDPDGNDGAVVKMQNLSSTRNRIVLADVAFDSNGDILIVTSDGMISSSLQCYRVHLSLEAGVVTVKCRSMASLYAHCHLESKLRDSATSRLTHVQFMNMESADVLLLAAGDSSYSQVELWQLTTNPHSLHQFYQTPNASPSQYSTQKWEYQSSISHGSLPISIATPRFPVSMSDVQQDVLFQYVAIAYRDGSLKLINKHTFQAMATTNLDYGISENEGNEKRRKVVAHIASMQQTFTGCGLVGVDQYNCLYVMKVVNTRDPVTQVPVVYLVGMLEYLLLSGMDWWDVLAGLKPGNGE